MLEKHPQQPPTTPQARRFHDSSPATWPHSVWVLWPLVWPPCHHHASLHPPGGDRGRAPLQAAVALPALEPPRRGHRWPGPFCSAPGPDALTPALPWACATFFTPQQLVAVTDAAAVDACLGRGVDVSSCLAGTCGGGTAVVWRPHVLALGTCWPRRSACSSTSQDTCRLASGFSRPGCDVASVHLLIAFPDSSEHGASFRRFTGRVYDFFKEMSD